jgi:hypothetical protein
MLCGSKTQRACVGLIRSQKYAVSHMSSCEPKGRMLGLREAARRITPTESVIYAYIGKLAIDYNVLQCCYNALQTHKC